MKPAYASFKITYKSFSKIYSSFRGRIKHMFNTRQYDYNILIFSSSGSKSLIIAGWLLGFKNTTAGLTSL